MIWSVRPPLPFSQKAKTKSATAATIIAIHWSSVIGSPRAAPVGGPLLLGKQFQASRVSSLQPPRAARRPAAVIRTVAISITLSSPPTLCERRHRDLSRDLIAVRRRAILVMSEGECPHPLRSDWRRCCFRDAANDDAIGQHVEVVVVYSPDGRESAARLRISWSRSQPNVFDPVREGPGLR